MPPLVAGFWGAYFGTAALMLLGAGAAYVRGLRRVALIACVSALMPALFVAAFLGVLGDAGPRTLAHVAVVNACVLALGMLALLGFLRNPARALRLRLSMAAVGVAVLAVGWLLDATVALALALLTAVSIGAVMFMVCLRAAVRRDRLAGLSLFGTATIVTSLCALAWLTFHHAAPLALHALAALSGMAYLVTISLALWLRYSYLLELREVLACGAAYDAVTRMRAHTETGQMVGLAFHKHTEDGRLVGVMAVSIGNLLTLNELHGPATVNHALFVSADRLRRSLPAGVQVGRLGEDAFLLLVRDVDEIDPLIQLGERIARRLARPVSLSTSAELRRVEDSLAQWVAQVGVGIVIAGAADKPSEAISRARAMSQAAWGAPSRVSWHDDGAASETPALAAA